MPNSLPEVSNATIIAYILNALSRVSNKVATLPQGEITAFGVFLAVDDVPQFMEMGGDLYQVSELCLEMNRQAQEMIPPKNVTIN